jgi:hypothetical protein
VGLRRVTSTNTIKFPRVNVRTARYVEVSDKHPYDDPPQETGQSANTQWQYSYCQPKHVPAHQISVRGISEMDIRIPEDVITKLPPNTGIRLPIKRSTMSPEEWNPLIHTAAKHQNLRKCNKLEILLPIEHTRYPL